MEPIEEYEHAELTIKIHHDDNAECPREWCDHLGTMACWHRRYNLGDKEHMEKEEIQEENKKGALILLPLFLYNHSGISMSTSRGYPFDCPWDSGQVGVIYVTKEKVRAEYSCQRITQETLKKVLEVLRAEVEDYDHYLTGQVFGYVIEDKKGEHLDSCWGFYGMAYCKEEAESMAQWQAEERKRREVAAWGGCAHAV
jgi:hypothetical protein